MIQCKVCDSTGRIDLRWAEWIEVANAHKEENERLRSKIASMLLTPPRENYRTDHLAVENAALRAEVERVKRNEWSWVELAQERGREVTALRAEVERLRGAGGGTAMTSDMQDMTDPAKNLADAARDISDRGILGAGKLDAIESGLIGALVEALVAYDEAQVPPSDAIPDDTKVICPACCHQFRAIPLDVQKELRELQEPPSDAEIEAWEERMAALVNALDDTACGYGQSVGTADGHEESWRKDRDAARGRLTDATIKLLMHRARPDAGLLLAAKELLDNIDDFSTDNIARCETNRVDVDNLRAEVARVEGQQ